MIALLIMKHMSVIMRFIQKIKEIYFNLLLNKSKILIGKRQKSYLNDSSTYNEAHVSYYAIYPKDKRNLFQSIIKQIKDIDWKKTKELSK